MQNQEVEEIKYDEGAGGYSLSLCYASFELRRHMVKASKQKQKETEVVQAGNLCKNGGGCSHFQINTFYDISLPRTSPHQEEVCLLGSNGEVEDPPLEAHHTFVTGISGREREIPLEKNSMVLICNLPSVSLVAP